MVRCRERGAARSCRGGLPGLRLMLVPLRQTVRQSVLVQHPLQRPGDGVPHAVQRGGLACRRGRALRRGASLGLRGTHRFSWLLSHVPADEIMHDLGDVPAERVALDGSEEGRPAGRLEAERVARVPSRHLRSRSCVATWDYHTAGAIPRKSGLKCRDT